MNSKSIITNSISWAFGILIFAIGLVNIFWGNDSLFGVFIVLLSLIYFPPVNEFLKKRTGFSIPVIIKIFLGMFIIWASLGVGELFTKIGLMVKDL